MKNIAIILAAGSGIRFDQEKPKQFFKIAGKMIIEHTIDVFQKHQLIDEIYIVSNESSVHIIETLVVVNSYNKVTKILIGGKERHDSSLVAINACGGDANLIFHDAVRPLISSKIIKQCIDELKDYNAVDVAIPATDTIIEIDHNKYIQNIPTRQNTYQGQTPQAFNYSTIKLAYDLALKDPEFYTTDDCGVIKKYLPNEPIKVIKGDNNNMKLTYEKDLFLLDKLFQIKTLSLDKSSLTSKEKSKLKGKVVVVFGGSYGIGKDIVILAKKNGMMAYSFSRGENHVDISNVNSVKKALEEVYTSEGRIDAVICTAGVLYTQSLEAISYDSLNESINVNYLGNIIVAKESFKYLKMTRGSLLLFTSSSYTRGRAMYSLYSSSKAAIVNFTQAISAEWESFGIHINCINPERTKTPMRIKNFGAEPENSLLDSKTVAKVAMKTIISDVTGQVIDVRR